jgi:acylpyruvate hydrolase
MRLAMIADDQGKPALAVIKGGLAGLVSSATFPEFRDLTSVISAGRPALEALALVVAGLPASAWRSLAGVEFCLPVDRPGKIICRGLNYADHAK